MGNILLFGLWLISWMTLMTAYLILRKRYGYKCREADYLRRMVDLLEGAPSKYDTKNTM